MRNVIFFAWLICLIASLHAQSVGINTNSPHASAALDIVSTTQGILAPRMTATQRSSIASPEAGLLVYQTDGTAGFYYYDGSSWSPVSGGGIATPISIVNGGTNATTAQGARNNLLPAQGGSSYNRLRSDGSNVSWYPTSPIRYYMVTQGIYPSYGVGCEGACMGSIVLWSPSITFNGQLMPCNGQLLSISQNTALFSLIGTIYGGNGTTHFALPNLNSPTIVPVGQ